MIAMPGCVDEFILKQMGNVSMNSIKSFISNPIIKKNKKANRLKKIFIFSSSIK